MMNEYELLMLVASAMDFAVPPDANARQIAFMLSRHIEQEMLPKARLGAALDAASSLNEIRPVDTSVPIDHALSTVKHLTVVGSKPFFNAQRIADCIASVEKLARLGAAVEAMPVESTLRHLKLHPGFAAPTVPWYCCVYRDDGYVGKEATGPTAMEVLTKVSE